LKTETCAAAGAASIGSMTAITAIAVQKPLTLSRHLAMRFSSKSVVLASIFPAKAGQVHAAGHPREGPVADVQRTKRKAWLWAD
jgi:hypothetical protein